MLKIYTKHGDAGDTSLACGARLPKESLRIEAYGTLDELSSVLGVVTATVAAENEATAWLPDFLDYMEWVQDRLFSLSSMLATANLPTSTMPHVETQDIEVLEQHIDQLNEVLPPLKNFILPGGSVPVSYLHFARTVCRRAERMCAALQREEKIQPVVLPFLNRLSDDLFVTARWLVQQRGEAEKIWLGRKAPGFSEQISYS